MMTKITNDYLEVTVSPEGATLTSIRDAKTGQEYLWQGNPAYWTGQAPNLFPFVGRLHEERYTLDGVSYPMTRHGFVRHAQMTLEYARPDQCCFALSQSPETLKMYPYRFTFRIVYRLAENTLHIAFQVENQDDKLLYCGMGGHPGFQVPMDPGLSFSDYRLTFPEACQPHQVVFSPSLQVAPERPDYPLEQGRYLPLRHDLFDLDAVVLADAPRQVTLSSPKGSHGVTVGYPQMPYVGFWHQPKTDAPYLCIEPWATLPGRDNTVEELSTLPDRIAVPAGQTFSNDWWIKVW